MFFFFNDTATTEIYTLSLHDALPICDIGVVADADIGGVVAVVVVGGGGGVGVLVGGLVEIGRAHV